MPHFVLRVPALQLPSTGPRCCAEHRGSKARLRVAPPLPRTRSTCLPACAAIHAPYCSPALREDMFSFGGFGGVCFFSAAIRLFDEELTTRRGPSRSPSLSLKIFFIFL
jgi:hypothetical protein